MLEITHVYITLLYTVVSNILVVALLCLVYGPLFMCVDTHKPLVGHIIGLIYLCLL